jgi:outer membrane protein OmpA-like peptidoglycan-associated protein
MRILAFSLFLFTLAFMLVARWFYVCRLNNLCGEEPPADVRLKTLRLMEGDTVILEGYDQFAFDSARVAPRLNENNNAFLDTLAQILERDTTKNLAITGLYRESESGVRPGFFENLGVARADAVRKLLMRRGIPENRVTLDHGISADTALREPMSFELYAPANLRDTFERVAFTFTNMTFSDANFEFDSDAFNPGEPFKLYADSVRAYLMLFPEKSLTIIGHTDNKGTQKYNLDLGIRRARSARAYFTERGVKNVIEVETMGEKRPVAPNSLPDGKDNPVGRQKNRRVNFVLE